MSGDLPSDRLRRIIDAVETIEESLGVLSEKRREIDRPTRTTQRHVT
jgi:hypothetical protein